MSPVDGWIRIAAGAEIDGAAATPALCAAAAAGTAAAQQAARQPASTILERDTFTAAA
jgi:hypothetical protein